MRSNGSRVLEHEAAPELPGLNGSDGRRLLALLPLPLLPDLEHPRDRERVQADGERGVAVQVCHADVGPEGPAVAFGDGVDGLVAVRLGVVHGKSPPCASGLDDGCREVAAGCLFEIEPFFGRESLGGERHRLRDAEGRGERLFAPVGRDDAREGAGCGSFASTRNTRTRPLDVRRLATGLGPLEGGVCPSRSRPGRSCEPRVESSSRQRVPSSIPAMPATHDGSRRGAGATMPFRHTRRVRCSVTRSEANPTPEFRTRIATPDLTHGTGAWPLR
jgi:hypothetical protein